MTGEQREAIVERAGILEYESGLDRKAATLRACEICFPADYRAMMESAALYPDGKTLVYEYLEGLIKGPETAIEVATLNAEIKKTETHGNAPDRPPMAQGTRRRGFERMAEYARGRSA